MFQGTLSLPLSFSVRLFFGLRPLEIIIRLPVLFYFFVFLPLSISLSLFLSIFLLHDCRWRVGVNENALFEFELFERHDNTIFIVELRRRKQHGERRTRKKKYTYLQSFELFVYIYGLRYFFSTNFRCVFIFLFVSLFVLNTNGGELSKLFL